MLVTGIVENVDCVMLVEDGVVDTTVDFAVLVGIICGIIVPSVFALGESVGGVESFWNDPWYVGIGMLHVLLARLRRINGAAVTRVVTVHMV